MTHGELSGMQLIRSVCSLALLIVFLYLMTKELKKFLAGKTTATFRTEDQTEQQLPQFTVCSRDAFKPRQEDFLLNPFSKDFINWPENETDILQAWNQAVYRYDEMVQLFRVKYADGTQDISHDENNPEIVLRKFLNSAFFGRCFVITVKANLTIDGYVLFDFAENQLPIIYIHQPGQEIGVVTNNFDPSVDFVRVKGNTELDISLQKSIKILDEKRDSCSSDTKEDDYSNCIKKFVVEKFVRGQVSVLRCSKNMERVCQIPQLSYFGIPASVPMCSNKTDATCVLKMAVRLSDLATRTKESRCLKACKQTFYNSGKKDLTFHGKEFKKRSRLQLRLASTGTLVQEDYVLFDFSALIASVGGSMGLFLGVSFMDFVSFGSGWLEKIFGDKVYLRRKT